VSICGNPEPGMKKANSSMGYEAEGSAL